MRGSIQQSGPSSWRIQIELTRVGDKRKRRVVRIQGTRKDAQRELTRLLSAADAGTLPDPTRQTIAEYLRAWLDGALGRAPKTLERYRELADRQIIPHLGDLKLQQLKPEHIERWHSALTHAGLSARTVGHAHRLLSLVLKRAVENGTLARNAAAIRRPPAAQAIEIEIFTPEQITAVLELAAGPRAAPYSLPRASNRLAPRRASRPAMERCGSRRRRASRRALPRGNESRPPAQGAQDETRPAQHRLAAGGDHHAPSSQDPANGNPARARAGGRAVDRVLHYRRQASQAERHQPQLAADVQGEETAASVIPRPAAHSRLDADPRRRRHTHDQPAPRA